MDNAFARKLFRTPEEFDVYREQTAAFRLKFGREMGPDDPFFFDPDAETPQYRSPEHAASAIDLIAVLMGQAGVDPAAIYAFKKTRGLFPSAQHGLTLEEAAEWNAAVGEYEEKLLRIARQ
jgi:hypothetical protein